MLSRLHKTLQNAYHRVTSVVVSVMLLLGLSGCLMANAAQSCCCHPSEAIPGIHQTHGVKAKSASKHCNSSLQATSKSCCDIHSQNGKTSPAITQSFDIPQPLAVTGSTILLTPYLLTQEEIQNRRRQALAYVPNQRERYLDLQILLN